MKFYLLTIFSLLLHVNLFSQVSGIELFEKVMNELTKAELEKLSPYEELIEQADNLTQESDKMQQDIDRMNVKFPHVDEKEQKQYAKHILKLEEKSIENIKSAASVYTQADTLLFSVFEKNISKIENLKSKERNKLANRLTKEAKAHIETAKQLASILNSKNNSQGSEIVILSKEIRHLQILALNKISQAYGIHLIWNDISELYKLELQRVEKMQIDYSSISAYTDSVSSDRTVITFAIRYLTRKTSIENTEVDALKNKFKRVILDIDDIWVHYSVGYYSSYHEAFRNLESENYYIVAFRNGLQTSLTNAINQTMNKE